MPKRKLALILNDIRSAHNVGAIFRSADVFGVTEITLAGITPYPIIKNDPRLPHVRSKAQQMIAKTALGAEKTVPFRHEASIAATIAAYHGKGYKIYALEQAGNSKNVAMLKPASPCALIVGNEVKGLPKGILNKCDEILEIPQFGQKESLNVAVAAGIALFALISASGK